MLRASSTTMTCSLATGIRRRALEVCLRLGGGYLSQACSSAEILATLYAHVMKLGPSEAPLQPAPFVCVPGHRDPAVGSGARYNGPRGPEWDRFFLSPVHYALALYCTLVEVGRLAPEALEDVDRDGSTLELIGAEHSPGMEVTAGSLGQALSVAGGVALGRRLRQETGCSWVLLSDGELQSGQTWEALQALSLYELGTVGIYIDANAQQCDGPSVQPSDALAPRIASFGAEVFEVDGHDVEALAAPLDRWTRTRPLVVMARTDPSRGLELLRSRPPAKLHHVRWADERERQAFRAALATLARDLAPE